MEQPGRNREQLIRTVAATVLLLVAAAIRLAVLPLPLAPPGLLAVVSAAAVAAFLISRHAVLRMATATLLAVFALDAATELRVMADSTRFESRSERSMTGTADRLARHLASIERELAQTSYEVVSRVSAQETISRDDQFGLLQSVTPPEQRGTRLFTDERGLVAWWGEDLPFFPEPFVEGINYRFDVTNLYVVHRQRIDAVPSAGIVESFARLPNFDPTHGISPGEWVAASRFHAGPMALADDARRALLRRHGDHDVYVDLVPRPRETVIGTTRSRGSTLSSLVLALGWSLAAAMAMQSRRRTALTVTAAIGFLVAARWALLLMELPHRWHDIGGFEYYGSTILGPLTRSPLDLLFTGLATVAIIWTLLRALRPTLTVAIAQAVLLALAAFGWPRLLENLVANSRIIPLPEHILPRSEVETILFAAVITFAAALVLLSRMRLSPRQTLIPSIVFAISLGFLAATIDGATRSHATLLVGVALFVAIWIGSLERAARATTLALGGMIALVAAPPLILFKEASERRFVEDTYAPLIAGEAGQLRVMLGDTLTREFTSIELDQLLPDAVDRTNLEDLAYVLWARSSLSDLAVPASITLEQSDRRRISRFGVGFQLPESDEDDRDVLRVGSLVRELLHHDFQLTMRDQVVARGVVHILEPRDAGATAFADTYRDFFALAADPPLSSPRTPQPVVFDREGTILGHHTLRLPQSPAAYFTALQPGEGIWVRGGEDEEVYLRRGEQTIFAFPVAAVTTGQRFRQIGGMALWGGLLAVSLLLIRFAPDIARFVASLRGGLGFRTRTSLYLGTAVVLPLLLFVLFVRAYLTDRLESEYLERGRNALNTAQRVIEDYVGTAEAARPDELDDDILTWLASVIGHDLHLFRDDLIYASSRRDLFSARIEPSRLRGEIYTSIVLGGRQLVLAEHSAGTATKFVEIYSPITLAADRPYILALPFVFQARQIEAQVNDLATTIYLLLIAIAGAALGLAYRMARTVTNPVQNLVAGARAVASGRFDLDIEHPADRDLALLVSTFSDMALSIDRQQEALRYERDRLRTLLENINTAVVVLDDRRIVATNGMARRLFQIGSEREREFHPPFPEVSRFLEEHGGRQADSAELELLIDDAPRTFRLSMVPLPGSVDRMLIAEDVTEILRSNRIEAWAEMARQVAHEIKNPLTPIQLTAEHLRTVAERNDPNLIRTIKTGVDNILRQVDTLRTTSREFSDFASLQNATFGQFDLGELLHRIAEGYRHTEERGIRLQLEIATNVPKRFFGDERLIRGAVANLLENAIQAATPGGQVIFRAHGDDSRVVIEVEDSGKGVAPDLLPKIFEPYFSTKSAGTGLGLAIARKAVDEHGGDIDARNLSEGGFAITVTLPVRDGLAGG